MSKLVLEKGLGKEFDEYEDDFEEAERTFGSLKGTKPSDDELEDEELDEEISDVGITDSTYYIPYSSIFDRRDTKYDLELFSDIVKDNGGTNIRTDNQYGWSNQPEVILFDVSDRGVVVRIEDDFEERLGKPYEYLLINSALDDWKDDVEEELDEENMNEETTKSLEELRDKIENEVDYVDDKPYSHNIISLVLRQIDSNYGREAVNQTIDDFNLEDLGWLRLKEEATVSADIATVPKRMGKMQKRKRVESDGEFNGLPVFEVSQEQLLSSSKFRKAGARYNIKNEKVNLFLKESGYRSSFYITNSGTYLRVK